MADEERNSGAPEMTGSTAPRAAQLKIKWDDSDMRSVYANVCKRLSILLNNVIRDYESRYGVMEVETRRPDDSTVQ